MSVLIRVPLVVEHLHTLAGYFTDGPSMAAVYGLVSHLEREADVPVSAFGLVVDRYVSYLGEYVKTSMDLPAKNKQDEMPAITGYRRGDLQGALYLKTDGLDTFELEDVVKDLTCAINAARFQGGLVSEFIGGDEHPIQYAAVADGLSLARFMRKHEKPLACAYLSKHLRQSVSGDALLDAYAEALAASSRVVLMCNGYVEVGMEGAHRIAEPNFTLAELVEMYRTDKLGPEELDDFEKRFFWQFDSALKAAHPEFYVVS